MAHNTVISQMISSELEVENACRSPKFNTAPPMPDINPTLSELIIPSEVDVAPSEPFTVLDIAALTQVLNAMPEPNAAMPIAIYSTTRDSVFGPSELLTMGK